MLATGFRQGAGGIGRDMINLLNGCAKAGVEVHVLLETGDNPDVAYLDPGVRCHLRGLGKGRTAIRRMRALLNDLEPSAVIANKDRPAGILVEAVEGLDRRPRTLVRVGTHQPAKLRRRNPFSRWRSLRRLRAVYPKADVLVGVSEGVCAGLREILGTDAPPIRCIYSAMDLAGIEAQAREEPSHPWFAHRAGMRGGAMPGESEDRLLVSVGRLSRIKNQDTILHALALLPEEFRFVIFGEGKQRGQLERSVRRLGLGGRVDLPGHCANPFAHVARADLFVLSSRFEGFGNALVEAMSIGTPVVSTDCPSGPREILDGGRYGRLVPVGNHRALAEAIRAAVEEPPPREMLKAAVARLEIDRAIEYYLDALGLIDPGDGKDSSVESSRAA